MHIALLPFEYMTKFDSGDRLRRPRKRSTGTRLRRVEADGE
jgi:hypothetical protein